jgi:hypothetical protein
VSALITKAGTIAIHADAPGQVGVSIPHSTHLHKQTTAHVSSGSQALELHTNPAVCKAELAAPIFSIVDGMNFGLSDGTGWISMDVGHIHIHGSLDHIHIQYPVDNPWISSTSMDVLALYPWISMDIHWM